MNHCSICGAALNDSTTSFCSECKHQLTGAADKDQMARKDKRKKKHRKHKKNKTDAPLQEIMGEAVDDGYDGYYNDVLPPDTDRIKDGLDKDLIRNIVALTVAVLFIISMCVVMLYIL